jgi:hypothetical protein
LHSQHQEAVARNRRERCSKPLEGKSESVSPLPTAGKEKSLPVNRMYLGLMQGIVHTVPELLRKRHGLTTVDNECVNRKEQTLTGELPMEMS